MANRLTWGIGALGRNRGRRGIRRRRPVSWNPFHDQPRECDPIPAAVQRSDRFETHKGGDDGREDANGEQHRDRRQEDHRIGGGDFGDEGRAHGERHRHRQGQPAHHARQYELQRLADHQRDDPRGRSADCQAHADLVPAARDEVGEHGIESGRGQGRRSTGALPVWPCSCRPSASTACWPTTFHSGPVRLACAAPSGASRGQIAGLILRQGLWKVGIGVVLGLIGAALLSRS
jgi:hypothetical protein